MFDLFTIVIDPVRFLFTGILFDFVHRNHSPCRHANSQLVTKTSSPIYQSGSISAEIDFDLVLVLVCDQIEFCGYGYSLILFSSADIDFHCLFYVDFSD